MTAAGLRDGNPAVTPLITCALLPFPQDSSLSLVSSSLQDLHLRRFLFPFFPSACTPLLLSVTGSAPPVPARNLLNPAQIFWGFGCQDEINRDFSHTSSYCSNYHLSSCRQPVTSMEKDTFLPAAMHCQVPSIHSEARQD